MTIKTNIPKGSVYDTLYVARMIRESRGDAGKHEAINIFDASQPRSSRLKSQSSSIDQESKKRDKDD